MLTQLRPAIVIFIALTIVTGVAYPLAVTGVAQTLFPHQANGSLIMDGDMIVGSELIGQTFDDPKYFWSRPSGISYNAAASSGTNYGPTNKEALLDVVKSRVENLKQVHPDKKDTPVPVDLVTASGSGLDPHISPAAAEYQVSRVVNVRGLNEKIVRDLVATHTEGRTFGVLGEPRVNVLLLNRALDRQAAEK